MVKNRFLHSRLGLAAQVLLALALAYAAASWAIDSGSIFLYLAVIGFCLFAVNRAFKVVKG